MRDPSAVSANPGLKVLQPTLEQAASTGTSCRNVTLLIQQSLPTARGWEDGRTTQAPSPSHARCG